MTRHRTTTSVLSIMIPLAAAGVVASCGGGSTALPPPGSTPTPAASPGMAGSMQVATGGTYPNYTYTAAAGAQVVFSCGCTVQAGFTTASAAGAFAIVANSTPTPSAPQPIYTIVPGRNYVLVGTGGAGGTPPEGWDIQFAGLSPNRNHHLNPAHMSDVYTAAVSLYVFNNSPGNGATAFDDWNFNALAAWYSVLTSSPDAQEKTLLNDIASQSAAGKTLFPSAPLWDSGHATNSTISADLTAVAKSGDLTLPTPCPSTGCLGAPSP